MAKQEKTNMFGSFGPAADEREQEQKRIEAAVTGKAAPEPETRRPSKAAAGSSVKLPKAAGRPRKRVNATCMTISIDQADKDLVKEYAFAHSVTVSDLVHTWINEHCVG